MPSRRTFVGLCGVAATGLAGCLGNSSSGSDSKSPDESTNRSTTSASTTVKTTDSITSSESPSSTTASASFSLPVETIRSVGDARVAVANPVVRAAVVLRTRSSSEVLVADGRQFVVVDVQSATSGRATAEGDPSVDAFSFVADGQTYPPAHFEQLKGLTKQYADGNPHSLAGRGDHPYGGPYATEVGWLAFEPPSALDASAAEIRCDYGGEKVTWSLPKESVSALGRSTPTFELRSFEATNGGDGSATVSLVAENVSDAGGEFLAAVIWPTKAADDDEAHIVRQSVDAGRRVEWSKTMQFDSVRVDSSSSAVTATVEGVVDGSTTVQVENTTTTA